MFGTSSDPVVLDGAYVSDGESLRVIDQIFETLVSTEPGGTEIVPALAESWTASDDGLEWTFNPVSYTHLRAHETVLDLVCRLPLEKKNTRTQDVVITSHT
mgnify:CR=1 FL=1